MSNLKFFMVESLKKDEIVEVPGLKTFKDDKGDPIPFQIRKLGTSKLNETRKAFTIKKIAKDERGKQIFSKAGEPIFSIEYEQSKAANKIIVDSLVFPNLYDKELMDFYGCVDALEMPMVLFKDPNDYKYISEQVMMVNGISEKEEMSDEELVDYAKNS